MEKYRGKCYFKIQ